MSFEVASWNNRLVGACLASRTSAWASMLASVLASGGGYATLSSRSFSMSAVRRSLPVSVGVARYRFMSWVSIEMLRARGSSFVSWAWRVTFVAARGR